MINKIALWVFGGVLLGVFALCFYALSTQKRLAECQKHAQNLENLIAQKELEARNYEETRPKIVEKIITKYEKVAVPADATCESRLKSVSDLLGAFYD